MSSMGNLFMQRDWHLSSALANHWLYSNRELNFARVDCLIYPSVQKDKAGINFAFHPDFVREHMFISSVKKIQLDKFNMEGLNFSLKEIGAIHGDKINWHIARFTFKRVDLLDKDWKSIKAFSQREIYENQFGFDTEEPFHLPTKLISILKDKIQIDLELTFANKSINPKPYLIKFEQEVEIEGMKVYGVGCYIEYIFENKSNNYE